MTRPWRDTCPLSDSLEEIISNDARRLAGAVQYLPVCETQEVRCQVTKVGRRVLFVDLGSRIRRGGHLYSIAAWAHLLSKAGHDKHSKVFCARSNLEKAAACILVFSV
jgi:hypothetical protein